MALRCNHDVQNLIGGYDACDSIYHIFKYTFKQQETIDSRAAATLATFNRRLQIEQQPSEEELTDEQLARRRIASLAISGTNKQEIAPCELPFCALYLRRQSSARFSHETVPLYLAQYIKILTSNYYNTLLLNIEGLLCV